MRWLKAAATILPLLVISVVVFAFLALNALAQPNMQLPTL